MQNFDVSAVSALLAEFGKRLELSGVEPFKVRAYYKAAENLAALTVPLDAMIAESRLRDIPGVGQALAEKITAFQRTGTHPKLEALRREMPAGVLEMLNVPGLKPEQVRRIYEQLHVTSLDELEQACRRGRLKDVKGFGPALEQRVLQGIDIVRHGRGLHLLHHARDMLDAAAGRLGRGHQELSRILPAGDFRRGCELVSDLRLVAETGSMKGAAELSGEIRVDLTESGHYGATLLSATGSREHVRQLAEFAADRGFTLEPTGLSRAGRLVASKTEEEIYAALGLPFIPPELREGLGEIELAVAGELPPLVEDADIRGVLHLHTELSDGSATLEEMAEAARGRGYLYYGVSDHSQTASYAGGLKVDQIKAQHALADELNAHYRGKFRVLKGIESDILQDGSLDYPENVLESFDFVVASVHSRFGLDEKSQTERLVRAVSNPFTTVLGHMTGRLLLRRKGYDVDVEKVLKACADHGVAVEINGNPHRLDLDWRWHQLALKHGCMLSINPDAHSPPELDLNHWAVRIARKGGVPKDRVLTCMDLEEITDFLAERRASRSAKPAATSIKKPEVQPAKSRRSRKPPPKSRSRRQGSASLNASAGETN